MFIVYFVPVSYYSISFWLFVTKNVVLHKDELRAGSVLIFLNLVHYFPRLMIVSRYPPGLFFNFGVDFFVPIVVTNPWMCSLKAAPCLLDFLCEWVVYVTFMKHCRQVGYLVKDIDQNTFYFDCLIFHPNLKLQQPHSNSPTIFNHRKCTVQLWPQPLSDCVPAVTLSPCGTDNTLELVENTASNQVTCTGFRASDTAVWRVLLPADNNVALCAAPPGSSGPDTCLDAIKPPLTASRTVSDRTSLTVDTTDEATYGFVFKGLMVSVDVKHHVYCSRGPLSSVESTHKPTTRGVSVGWILSVSAAVFSLCFCHDFALLMFVSLSVNFF